MLLDEAAKEHPLHATSDYGPQGNEFPGCAAYSSGSLVRLRLDTTSTSGEEGRREMGVDGFRESFFCFFGSRLRISLLLIGKPPS